MDNPVRYIAPFINDRFKITSKWWNYREDPITHVTTLHKGLDIATSGKKNVYSILDGVVHSIGYNSSRGNWIIIADDNPESPTYGYASLYMHLNSRPLLIIGTHITKGAYVGVEGSTGKSTGVHLHVEMQDISRFNWEWHTSSTKSDYLDPTQYMGIDNIQGTWWIYTGFVPPTPPRPAGTREHHFKWVLFNKQRKIRNLIK